MAFVAYHRLTLLENYNQYADNGIGGGRGDVNNSMGADSGSGAGGYIDYFNQPPTPMQTGFDATSGGGGIGGGTGSSVDDEFIAGGRLEQPATRAGDTDLLTS